MTSKHALCLWLTGLSGAGKTTIANLLKQRLQYIQSFILDGDDLRKGLNNNLGFTAADRVENVRRTAEVARLISIAGPVIIVACMSPFRNGRAHARSLFKPGEFYEIFIDTPIEECERRDIKGLYTNARKGIIKDFTGIDLPYERPWAADLVIKTIDRTPEECVEQIITHLVNVKNNTITIVGSQLMNAAGRYQSLGNLEDAERYYRTALRYNPELAIAHNNLATVLVAQKKIEEAIFHFHQATIKDLNYAEAFYNLGITYQDQNSFDYAITHLQHAITIKPDYVEALTDLSFSLKEIGELDEAKKFIHKALKLNPSYAPAHNTLAQILQTLGDINDALSEYETAIRIDPNRPEYHTNLSVIRKYNKDDLYLNNLEGLAKNISSFTTDQQIRLDFALAKAYNDTGQYGDAFSHLLQGNTLMRQQISYDNNEALESFERIKKVFNRDFIRQQGQGNPSEVPIFIFGMPRSGSTLVEQILASHPKVFGGGELVHFVDAINVNPVSSLPTEELRNIASYYFTRLCRLAPEAERITDKGLGNFQRVAFMHLVFPNARLIHVRRNPMDTCLSCFSTLFAKGLQPYAYDLKELGSYYKAYTKLMDHWREVLPGVMYEIQYEELVNDFERQAHRLIEYCGLEWSSTCLDFHKIRRPIYTASVAQVREPINKSSINRWHNYKYELEPLLDALK